MLLFCVMLTPLGRISYSATTVTIGVDPPMLFAELGEHFTVNLTIIHAVDVYTWQVNLTFDPNVVNCTDATLPTDHFLADRPQGTVGLQKTIYNQSVVVGTAILGDYEGMHGSGTLVTIEFEVVGTGESVLGIDDTPGVAAWTMVGDQFLIYTYPPYIELEDGYVSNVDHPPTAFFTHSPTLPNVNENVTFDATLSSDPDGHIIRYEWDFGDGNYATETIPTTTHAYTAAETYAVVLTVIDNATATQKMMDTFNTTGVPHLWYELHSSYSEEVKFRAAHDIVVISPSASPARVTVGGSVVISVTVANHGNETENFNVVAYANGDPIANKTVSNLAPDDEEPLELTWVTTDVTPDVYTISVEASLAGDGHPDDNSKTDGTVTVELPQEQFPIEYVIIGVVCVVAIGVGIFFFLRKRKSPAT